MTVRGISILFLFVLSLCCYGASGPQVTTTVSPKGIANGLSVIRNNGAAYGPDSTNGLGIVSTTCGIQEALDSLFYTNALGPVPGSGKIVFQNGVYEFSGQVVINNAYPLDLTWEGAGKIATILKYNGTGNAIVDIGHANLPAPRLQFVCKGIGFAYTLDTNPSTLVKLMDVNECYFEDCLWTTWQTISNSPYSTLNYIPSAPLTSVATIGAYIGQGSDNQHRYKNCTFYGLAVGLWDNGDHVRVDDTMFANCGFTKNGGVAAYTNLYAKYVGVGNTATNVLSMGGAITASTSAFEDTWINRCHFHFCNAALVVYVGAGAWLKDCIFEGMNYCTLLDADNYNIIVDDFTGGNLTSNGDHLFTPGTAAIGAASGVVTHWQRDVFTFGSMLNINVGGSAKFDLSSAGVLTANGSGLTALNANNITSGTLPNTRLVSVPNSALANSSITVNGTSVSLGGSVTAPGYTIDLYAIGNNSMVAGTTYFYGQMSSRTINTTYSVAQIDVPRAGTIKRVMYKIDVSGTLGTAGQNITHTINVNNTTDCASSAFDYSGVIANQVVSGVSQAVSVGDTIVLKVVTPGTWTTPATSVRLVAQVYIE